MARNTRMAAAGTGRRAIRLSAFIGLLALTAAYGAKPGSAASAAESARVTTTASVMLVDRLTLMKFSDIDIGGAALPAGGHATLELLPSGSVVNRNGADPSVQNSFSAVFTLAGSPNQTFGISLPGAITLTSGGSSQSVRAFLHDAGQLPVLANTGRGRFHVGAILSVGRTDKEKTQVYVGAFDVIVSNN